MTLKKWAWDIFENTGSLEAFLTAKEAETQENSKVLGKVEFGNIEVNNLNNPSNTNAEFKLKFKE